jgi:predicted DNA-binding protein
MVDGGVEMKRLTLRLPDDLYEKVRWLSYRDRQSQHAIIQEILEKALDDVEVPQEVQE